MSTGPERLAGQGRRSTQHLIVLVLVNRLHVEDKDKHNVTCDLMILKIINPEG